MAWLFLYLFVWLCHLYICMYVCPKQMSLKGTTTVINHLIFHSVGACLCSFALFRSLWQVCICTTRGKQRGHGQCAQLHLLSRTSNKEEFSGYHADCEYSCSLNHTELMFCIIVVHKALCVNISTVKTIGCVKKWNENGLLNLNCLCHMCLSSRFCRISCVVETPPWQMSSWPSSQNSHNLARPQMPKWPCVHARLDHHTHLHAESKFSCRLNTLISCFFKTLWDAYQENILRCHWHTTSVKT